MNKLRRFLPIVLLILVLAFYLYPSGDHPAAPAADSAVAAATDAQNLAASSPKASAQPSAAPAKPKSEKQKPATSSAADSKEEEELLPEDGSYTTKDDVALYLHQYGHLPSNFITKGEARKAGWSGGSLEEYFPGMCIGGDTFGNREGTLPSAKGRTWSECDIDTLGRRSRGAKRILYSNDGLIYYTDDHYESYTQLY